MPIGLKKNTVVLCPHEDEWDKNAEATIKELYQLFGAVTKDIQHIGSTAIPTISAKAIIDIVVGIYNFDLLDKTMTHLKSSKLIHRPNNDLPEYRMFVICEEGTEIRTHHIHVVTYNSEEWNNQLNFRDYLNSHQSVATEYEQLKITLQKECFNDRVLYTKSKDDFIHNVFLQAKNWRKKFE